MSNDKVIQKTGFAKFKISTKNVPNSTLDLDFNPVIEQFNLKGDYYLIHWQARPKGHRQWGIYNSRDDSYTSTLDTKHLNYGGWQPLQLDDKTANSIPSAVVFFQGQIRLWNYF